MVCFGILYRNLERIGELGMKKKLIVCAAMAIALLLCACGGPCETHEFGEWEIVHEASCTQSGQRTRNCLNCETVEEEVIDATGHSFGDWSVVKEATCTEEGSQVRKCANCDAMETESLAVINHSYGEWEQLTEPDCLQAGEKREVCEVCGHEVVAEVPALGHDYVDLYCTRCEEQQYPLSDMYKFYDTEDGLSVKINSFTVSKQEGFNMYRLNWTIKNVTENSEITHGQFRLYLSDGTWEYMYGMFPYLYYKESYTFYYDWKMLKDKDVVFVEYVSFDNNDKEPDMDAPRWLAP